MIDIKTEQRLINGDEAALDEIIEAVSPVIAATLRNFTGGDQILQRLKKAAAIMRQPLSGNLGKYY